MDWSVASNKFCLENVTIPWLADSRKVIEHELIQTNDLWLSIKQLNKSRVQLLFLLLYSKYAYLHVRVQLYGVFFFIFLSRFFRIENKNKIQFLCARKQNSSHAHSNVFRNIKSKTKHTRENICNDQKQCSMWRQHLTNQTKLTARLYLRFTHWNN